MKHNHNWRANINYSKLYIRIPFSCPFFADTFNYTESNSKQNKKINLITQKVYGYILCIASALNLLIVFTRMY